MLLKIKTWLTEQPLKELIGEVDFLLFFLQGDDVEMFFAKISLLFQLFASQFHQQVGEGVFVRCHLIAFQEGQNRFGSRGGNFGNSGLRGLFLVCRVKKPDISRPVDQILFCGGRILRN